MGPNTPTLLFKSSMQTFMFLIVRKCVVAVQIITMAIILLLV